MVVEENHLAPRRSGNNPIVPHTELWAEDAKGKFTGITKGILVRALDKDASNIFSYRTEPERQAYAVERAKITLKLELIGCNREIESTKRLVEQKTKSLSTRQTIC